MLHAYQRLLRLSVLSTSVAFNSVCQRATLPALTRMNHNCCCGDSSGGEESSACSSSDDDHKRIRLPILKYGYRTEPLEWDELIDIIHVQQDLAKLSRSVEQQRDYEIYKRDLLQKWISVIDHVLVTKFPDVFEQRFNATMDRYYAYPPLSEAVATGDTTQKVLVENDFPYYNAIGIEHWILWKLGSRCTEEDIDEAKMQLQERFANDILHWVNPPHLKSLPEIDHVHILGRLQESASD